MTDLEMVAELSTRLQPLPGRVALLMDPLPTHSGVVVLTDYGKKREQSMSGTVCMSGVECLKVGDRAQIHNYSGLIYEHGDASWVPEGREVRFLNDSDAVWAKYAD